MNGFYWIITLALVMLVCLFTPASWLVAGVSAVSFGFGISYGVLSVFLAFVVLVFFVRFLIWLFVTVTSRPRGIHGSR